MPALSTHVRFLGLALAGLMLFGCSKSETKTSAAGDSAATADAASDPAAEKAEARRALTPKPTDADLHPRVELRTNVGTITLKLDAEKAPITVRNFLAYVANGQYDQTIFHQIESGYIALGGGYREDQTEKAGRYPIHNEADNGLKNRRGTIAMARSPDAVDSAVCQFYLNLADNPNLDHHGDSPEEFGYCVFGEVVDGLDVLDKLGSVQVQDTEKFQKLPVETVKVESVRQLR